MVGKRTAKAARKSARLSGESGRLRIGDDWNAINIIALSQSNPLKAVAEFVENSIDAGAKHVEIVRGKEAKQTFLRITDDGAGIPLDANGLPNFQYVATHICDSVKRQLKAQGRKGIQGEFGIGLLSFWTVGEQLRIVSPGRDGHSYEMHMTRGVPTYRVSKSRRLLRQTGTTLAIHPLLSGIRQFSGEKLQRYLASELRDRIRHTGVRIRIIDKQSRTEHLVEPRQFAGQLLHLPPVLPGAGEVYVELYLGAPHEDRRIGLYRAGTRVVENLREIDGFDVPPWNSPYLEGLIDAPQLSVSPGTRSGIIHDAALTALIEALQPITQRLEQLIREQEEAEQERATRDTWRSIRRAFQEALLALPDDEYEWFRVEVEGKKAARKGGVAGAALEGANEAAGGGSGDAAAASEESHRQLELFEHVGPLFNVRISPSTCTVAIEKSKALQAVARDRNRKPIEEGVTYQWEVLEGGGTLSQSEGPCVEFQAPVEPALAKVRVTATQGAIACQAEALITITDSLLSERSSSGERRGLPSYTFHKAPGQLWRSRFDVEQNVIVINKGHRDFVFASRHKSLQLRYVCRLFAKELVVHNFPGLRPEQLLERMIELSLYTEENLR